MHVWFVPDLASDGAGGHGTGFLGLGFSAPRLSEGIGQKSAGRHAVLSDIELYSGEMPVSRKAMENPVTD